MRSGNDTARGSFTYEGDLWRSDGSTNDRAVINLNCRDKPIPNATGTFNFYERASGEDQTIFDHPRVDFTEDGQGRAIGMSLLSTDIAKNALGSRLVTRVRALLLLNVADCINVHYKLTL